MVDRPPLFRYIPRLGGLRLLIVLTYGILQGASSSTWALSFNLYTRQNGKGLELDGKLLKENLVNLGHKVHLYDVKSSQQNQIETVDINLFFEILEPSFYSKATFNLFVPNPEWYVQDPSYLNKIDWILCRTHLIEKLFTLLNKPTYYLGFASQNIYQPIQKNIRLPLHLAGGSSYKGTPPILEAWHRNPKLPKLTFIHHLPEYQNYSKLPNLKVISRYLPKKTLLRLKNQAGIHLCPSEAEGFGHTILEAMSTGAVVITTDAPPMNEFIEDKRCLVPVEKTVPCCLASRFLVSSQTLETTLLNILALPDAELHKIGDFNRKKCAQLNLNFKENLKKLIAFLEGKLRDKQT